MMSWMMMTLTHMKTQISTTCFLGKNMTKSLLIVRQATRNYIRNYMNNEYDKNYYNLVIIFLDIKLVTWLGRDTTLLAYRRTSTMMKSCARHSKKRITAVTGRGKINLGLGKILDVLVLGGRFETDYTYDDGTSMGDHYPVSATFSFVDEPSSGISSLQPVTASEFYSVEGRRRFCLQRGLNIVRTADGRVRKVVKK